MNKSYNQKPFSGFGEGTSWKSPIRFFGGFTRLFKNPSRKGGGDNISVPMHGDEAHGGGEGNTTENTGPLDESGNPIFQNLNTSGGGGKWGGGQMIKNLVSR